MDHVDPEKIDAFIDEYFVDWNATRALIRVLGLDYDTMAEKDRRNYRSLGHYWLQHQEIRDELDRRLAEWRAARRLSRDAFADQLLDAARADVLDFYTEDGALRPLSEIPPHARRQIASIETEEVWGKDASGAPVVVGYTKKVKLWDRRKGEEMWGRWQKMFTDKVEQSGPDGKPQQVNLSIVVGD
jgi:phage terminase small subunit